MPILGPKLKSDWDVSHGLRTPYAHLFRADRGLKTAIFVWFTQNSHVLTLRSHVCSSCYFPLYLLYFVHEPQSLSSFVNCCDFRDDAERLYQFWHTPRIPILRHLWRLTACHLLRLPLPFLFFLAVSRHQKRAPLNVDAPKVKITEKF